MNTMAILDVLPSEIVKEINYSEYGFSYREIKTIAEQYALGKITVAEIVEQVRNYGKKRIKL